MKRYAPSRFVLGPALALLTLAWITPAQAVVPFGTPVGGPNADPSTATDSLPNNQWTSTVYPNPAIARSSCPWITDGLSAQGFTAANGWTINYTALQGGLSINNYYAWVTNQPTENINATNYGGQGPFADFGGADLRLTYTPQGTDPTTIHWMQAIYTNKLLNNGIPNVSSVVGGVTYYEYLDNAGTYNTNPYYDNGGLAPAPDPANNTAFVDVPARSQLPTGTTDWEAQVFVSTWNPGAKTINIYTTGVWWGFNLTAIPEPGTLLLLVVGSLTALNRRHRLAA